MPRAAAGASTTTTTTMSLWYLRWLVLLQMTIARVHAVVDVVAQLHRIQQHQAAASSPAPAPSVGKVLLQNLPAALSRRLAETQLRWQDLSALVQRALLWDTGLVLTAEGKLVQVFVPCGKTMSQLFLPRQAFEAKKRDVCAVESCGESVHFASANCSVAAVQRIAQCAIEDVDLVVSATANSSLWSEDGEMASAPDIRVYRYAAISARSSANRSSSSSSSNITSTIGSSGSGSGYDRVGGGSLKSELVLFTINEKTVLLQSGAVVGGTGSCSTSGPFFIAPCVQRTAVNRDAWCEPERGGYLDLWLETEFGAGSTATTTEVASASHGMATSTIVLIVLLAVVGIVVGAFALLHVLQRTKRSRRAKGMTVTTSAAGSDRGPSTEEIPTLSATEDRQSVPALLSYPSQLFTTRALAGNNANGSNEESEASDIAALNESIFRRSIEMSTFCADTALMAKRIQYSELIFDSMLARGANGEVWKGEVAGQVVAIKQLLQEKRHDKNAIEQFAKEIRLASRLEHPNIVRFVGFSWKRLPDLCTISEFMGKGDLSDLINSTLSGRMTWNQEKLSIAIDIANALVYLHTLEPLIIHRDLKSLNVLLNDCLQAKLSDFGLSRTRSFEETMTCGIGTLLWTAPEILRGEAYSEKADIFSYGIVLSELDTCLPPYALNDEVSKQQLTNMQLINLVAKGRIKPRFRGDCPVALEHLATSCVAADPAKRPNAMQIVLALTSKVMSSYVCK